MRHFRKLGGALILTAMLCPAAALSDAAAHPDPTMAVNARDDLYTRGSEQQDLKLLSSVWADSFIDTNESGKVRDKQQMLAAISAEKNAGERILSIVVSDRRTMVYGAAAVVTGMFTTQVRQGGKTQTFKGRFTDLWIRQHNTWNCVAAHSSSIQ